MILLKDHKKRLLPVKYYQHVLIKQTRVRFNRTIFFVFFGCSTGSKFIHIKTFPFFQISSNLITILELFLRMHLFTIYFSHLCTSQLDNDLKLIVMAHKHKRSIHLYCEVKSWILKYPCCNIKV